VRRETGKLIALLAFGSGICLLPLHVEAAESSDVRTHAEQSFDRLTQQTEHKDSQKSASTMHDRVKNRSLFSSDQYVIGKGQGDMAKGPIVCQRVSELSARTDLAKQIRILVKEHMVDRIRERTGRDAEQDIEVTREEIVQEYLQGVRIVDRQVDEAAKTCSATAVMLKSQIQPKQAPDHLEPASTIAR